MIEERINHTKVFMPIMEELIKTLKQSQKELTEAKISLKRIEILSKYRDWIKRLRSVVVRKMNEEEGKKFENWDGLEETLRDEMDNKDLYEDHGKYYDLKYTKRLESILKGFNLTRSDFDHLLHINEESISEFHNKKTSLRDLDNARLELAQTTFPKNMADTKKTLEKALNALGIWKKEFYKINN